MNFSPIIHKVRTFLKVNGLFDIPYQEQKRFFESLPIPNSLKERSYLQYRCLEFFENGKTILLLNIVGFLLGNIYLLYSFVIPKPSKKQKVDAVADAIDGADITILPDSLLKEFSNYFETEFDNRPYLNWDDLKFIVDIIYKYPFKCWFLFKIIFKVSKYSSYIHAYSPRAFIVHNEYSFTSSILTGFCRRYDVEHINYQHGERMWQIQCGFSEYDRFYVWDSYYVDLLKCLGVSANFIVERPKSVNIDEHACLREDCYRDVKYYLGIYAEDEIRIIAKCMKQFEKLGFTWCVRLHPSYSDKKLAQKYISTEHIEKNDVTIEQSIINSKYACSVYSTVLYQAYMNGKQIILDNLSAPNKYNQLSDFKYILIDKKHTLLSDFINYN